MTVHLGTSGWQYRHWRGTFYPRGVAQTRWLEFFAERFATVELNNSFYHLPKEETFCSSGSSASWTRWGTEADTYVYFNNDPRACALRDAIVFHDLLEAAGFTVTRVARRSEVRIGGVEEAAWATSS